MSTPIPLDQPANARKPGDFRRKGTDGPPYVSSLTRTRQPTGNKPELITKAEARGITVDGLTVAQLKEALGTEPADQLMGRPSGFGGPTEDDFQLRKYLERNTAAGVLLLVLGGLDPATVDLDDRTALDRLVLQAQDAIDGNLWADRGTHVHKLCERVETGKTWGDLIPYGETLGIPAALQHAIMDKWATFRQGLQATAIAAELPMVNDVIKVAGTFDLLDTFAATLTTVFGDIEPGGAVIADIKTGATRDKYAIQIAGYQGGVPYDTETDTRTVWPTQPVAHVGLIYHMSMKDAIAGEPFDWEAIPVDLQAGRDGARICCEARDWPHESPFGSPVQATERRQLLRRRYQDLTDTDKAKVIITDPDDLDAIEKALNAVDPFQQVTPLGRPTPTVVAPAHVVLDEGPPASTGDVEALRATVAMLDAVQAEWVSSIVKLNGNLSVRQNPSARRYAIGQALSTLALAGWHDNELLAACMTTAGVSGLASATADQAIALEQVTQELAAGRLTFSVNLDGDMQLQAA